MESFQSGVNMLLYGLGSWLAAATIASIIIFIVLNLQLNKAARVLEDAEASEGSRSSTEISKTNKRRKGSSLSKISSHQTTGNFLNQTNYFDILSIFFNL